MTIKEGNPASLDWNSINEFIVNTKGKSKVDYYNSLRPSKRGTRFEDLDSSLFRKESFFNPQ